MAFGIFSAREGGSREKKESHRLRVSDEVPYVIENIETFGRYAVNIGDVIYFSGDPHVVLGITDTSGMAVTGRNYANGLVIQEIEQDTGETIRAPRILYGINRDAIEKIDGLVIPKSENIQTVSEFPASGIEFIEDVGEIKKHDASLEREPEFRRGEIYDFIIELRNKTRKNIVDVDIHRREDGTLAGVVEVGNQRLLFRGDEIISTIGGSNIGFVHSVHSQPDGTLAGIADFGAMKIIKFLYCDDRKNILF